MIKNVHIQNFKCLEYENLELGSLNILTGVNSSGKSSVIKAILLMCEKLKAKKQGYSISTGDLFNTYRNKYVNAKEITLELDNVVCKITDDSFSSIDMSLAVPIKDENMFYLSESRSGPEEIALRTDSLKIGDEGQFIFDLFEKIKDRPIHNSLIKTESQSLYQNLDYWMSLIFGTDIELKTEKIFSNIKISYNFDKLENISPLQLGAGLSYVAKILILCLQAQPKQIVIIENPEIHLHPAAQSKLGHFFAHIASRGIQLILETHCEHLINRVRYEVYKNNIMPEQVKIFYKNSHREPFIHFTINKSGKYQDKEGNLVQFPSGFFDSTLNELLEIG
jgi:predicted ATPase